MIMYKLEKLKSSVLNFWSTFYHDSIKIQVGMAMN